MVDLIQAKLNLVDCMAEAELDMLFFDGLRDAAEKGRDYYLGFSVGVFYAYGMIKQVERNRILEKQEVFRHG